MEKFSLKKPKLRTYVSFKESLLSEDYIRYCKSRSQNSLIAQFRLGILPLKIETGRFTKIQIIDRKCNFCPELVEDEHHFLLHCPKYIHPCDKFYNEALN